MSKEIQIVLSELEEYLELDCSKQSELCHTLIGLLNYSDVGSSEFNESIVEELAYQLSEYKNYCTIERSVKIIPERKEEVVELVWD